MSTCYLSTQSDIKSLSDLLFTPKYTRSVGNITPDYDEICVSGEAYILLKPHIKSNSLWNVEAQIPIRAAMGVLNPIGAVKRVVKDIGQAVVGDLISPPTTLTKGCRCIGSYYRVVRSDYGNELRASWSPFRLR